MAESRIGKHIAKGGRFWGPAPTSDFSGRFPEITELRRTYYRETLTDRSPSEVEAFIGRLGLNEFVDPQRTARPGAKRTEPVAAAALDPHGSIVAFAHGYSEVSSSKPSVLGIAERTYKRARVPGKNYFAFSEVVYAGEHDELTTAVTGLLLTNNEQTATWYPYSEEEELHANLEDLGFRPDRYPIDWPNAAERGKVVTEEKHVFGDGAVPALQERWTSPAADLRIRIADVLADYIKP